MNRGLYPAPDEEPTEFVIDPDEPPEEFGKRLSAYLAAKYLAKIGEIFARHLHPPKEQP